MPAGLDTQNLTHVADLAWNWAEIFLPRLLAAVVILIVGFVVAGWLGRVVRRMLSRAQIDPTLRPILAAVVRYAVIILVVVAGLGQLGIQTASLLAVLGAAGLAIGLALQGTLSNIAAGIMLLWLRPFHIGDYIEVGAQSGAVQEIGLFACQLRTFDGLFLLMPNSAIWNQPLKNHTRNGSRLVSVSVSVPVGAELDQVRRTLVEVAAGIRFALRDPAPTVFIDNFTSGALILNLMVWAAPQEAGELERSIIEGSKRALDALGVADKPTQIVRILPPDSDPSRFMQGSRPVNF